MNKHTYNELFELLLKEHKTLTLLLGMYVAIEQQNRNVKIDEYKQNADR